MTWGYHTMTDLRMRQITDMFKKWPVGHQFRRADFGDLENLTGNGCSKARHLDLNQWVRGAIKIGWVWKVPHTTKLLKLTEPVFAEYADAKKKFK